MSDIKAELIKTDDIYPCVQLETVQAIMSIVGIEAPCHKIHELCNKQSFEVCDVADKVTIRVIQAYHSMINAKKKASIIWTCDYLKRLTETLDLFYHFDGFFHVENLARECQFLMPVDIKRNDFWENIVAPIQRFNLNKHSLINQATLGLALALYLVSFIKSSVEDDAQVNFAPIINAAFFQLSDNQNLPLYIAQAMKNSDCSNFSTLSQVREEIIDKEGDITCEATLREETRVDYELQ